MAAVWQLDAAPAAKRLRDGRQAKAARGGYAGGAPAYGLRAQARELTADAAEAAIVAHMRAWQNSGLSLRRIAERLNVEGTPTKRDGRWHPTTVACALSDGARKADRRDPHVSARTGPNTRPAGRLSARPLPPESPCDRLSADGRPTLRSL
jgi:Recombinase